MNLRLGNAEIDLKIFHPRGANTVATLRQDELEVRGELKHLNSDSGIMSSSQLRSSAPVNYA
jgi:hypothetical protein